MPAASNVRPFNIDFKNVTLHPVTDVKDHPVVAVYLLINLILRSSFLTSSYYSYHLYIVVLSLLKITSENYS